MNDCLCVSEIASRVYGFLPPKSALSLALTCRTLLEPGLDEIWRDIQSLEPLIACLPKDLWREERLVFADGTLGSTVLHLRRELIPEDLNNYVTRYAKRVRSLSLGLVEEPIMPSEESLLALSVATGNQAGALSPLLQRFEWPHIFSPHVSLFLGDHITDIRIGFTLTSQPPPRLATVQAVVKRLSPQLQKLAIFTKSDAEGTSFTDQHIIPYSWDSLESLTIVNASAALLSRLATLPRLSFLSVFAVERDADPKPPMPGTFLALVTLQGTSTSLSDAENILRLLPGTNTLKTLDWTTYRSTNPADRQGILNIVSRFCNPFALCSLILSERPLWNAPSQEPIGMDIGQKLDLSPLYGFNCLRNLTIDLETPVQVTPEDIPTFTKAWPLLHRLELCQSFFTSHIPLINHTHVVALTSKLPLLRDLGIRFNTTDITGIEHLAEPHSTIQLQRLLVGTSPICSPSRVAAFIDTQFPQLRHLGTYYYQKPDPDGYSMLDKRWQAAYDAWFALASQTRHIIRV